MILKLCLYITLSLSILHGYAQTVGNSINFRLKSPSNEVFTSSNVNFSWTERSGAISYRLYLKKHGVTAAQNSVVMGRETTMNLAPGDYDWRVYANFSNGTVDSTNQFTFSIFNVGNVANLNLWLEADSGITLTNGQVSSWQEQSNAARILTQGIPSFQPTINDSAINNHAAVIFDNAADNFTSVANVNDSNYYISTVYSFSDNSRFCRLLTSAPGGNNWVLAPYLTHNLANGFGFIGPGVSVVKDRFVVSSAYADKVNIKHILNGIAVDSSSFGKLPGVLNISATNADRFSGALAEVIAVNGGISLALADTIDQYLMDKYAPPIILGSDTNICNYPFSFDIQKDHYIDYSWSNGDTSSMVSIQSPGTHTVTVTDIFGRQSIDSIIIETIPNTANFDLLPNDTTICLGDTLDLKLNAPQEYIYSWNDGVGGRDRKLFQQGQYILTIAKCGGEVEIDTINLTVNDLSFSLFQDTTVCFYDSVQLEPSIFHSGVSYYWRNQLSDSILIVKSSGVYDLRVENILGCRFSDTVEVTVDSVLFNLTLGSDRSLCEGNKLEITPQVLNIDSYLWSTGSTDSVITADTTGLYTVQITEGLCVVRDSVAITIKGVAPLVDFSIGNSCVNDSVRFTNLTTDPNNVTINNVKWYYGDGDSSSLNNPVYLYDSAKTYAVRLIVENDSGCVAFKEENINVYPTASSNFSFSTACENDSVSFTNTSTILQGSIGSVKWDFGLQSVMNDTSSLLDPKFLYAQMANYNVALTTISDQGCRDTISKNVTVNPKPIAVFQVKTPYVGDTAQFFDRSTITSGQILSSSWVINGSNFSTMNPKVFMNSLGKIETILTVTSDSRCVGTIKDSVDIVDRPPPVPFFSTVYPKNGQVFSGAVPINFIWNLQDSANLYRVQASTVSTFSNLELDTSSSSNELTLNINPLLDKIFWRVIALKNNRLIDTTNVAQFDIFSPTKLDSLTLWLTADSVKLVNGLDVENWYDRSDSGRVLVQSNPSFQPSLVKEVLNGYDAVDFDVNVDIIQNVCNVRTNNYYISSVYNFHEATGRFCRLITGDVSGSNWLLGPYLSHRLYAGRQLISTGVPIIQDRFALNSAYSVNDSVSNIVNGVVYGKGSSGTVPPGNLTLGALGPDKYNGSIAEIIMVDGTISEDDQRLADQYLMDKYAPPVDLGIDRRVCSYPDSIGVSVDYVVDYLWSTGDTTKTIEVDSSGLYYLETTDIFGRTSVDSMFYILDTFNYEVSFPQKRFDVCLGDTIQLSVPNNRFEYLWNNGDTTSFSNFAASGVYKLSVTNCLAMTSEDSIELVFNSPQFSLGNDTTICHNQITTIQSDSNFMSVIYAWTTGETTPSILTDTSGVYGLQVIDSFGCSFRDTIDVQIDSTLYNLTLGNDTSLCTGNEIRLINPNSAITTYSWSTGDLGAQTIVDTAGAYKVTVGNGRCIVSDTVNISIQGEAPLADFSFSNLCFQDTVIFNNASVAATTNDTIVRWDWRFGNGDSAITPNITYRYSQRNQYRVSLEIETDKACIDTISKLIEISPLPVANFNFPESVICERSSILHEDSSYISKGSIVDYSWNFDVANGNSATSTLQNPFYTYDTTGIYQVSLKVESNLGCLDSVEKPLFVRTTPIPQFTVDGFCTGTPITLLEQTFFPLTDTLEYFWTIRHIGSPFTTDRRRNPTIQLDKSGDYDIGLRTRYYVNANEWCEARIKDTISFFNSPKADFSSSLICENDSFQIKNQSTPIDSIVSYSFLFNQSDSFDLSSPTIPGVKAGQYPLSLLVRDTNQCVDSISKLILVNEKPVVQFSILNNNSGIPFKVDLENSTTNAVDFLWQFGNGDTSISAVPEYTYNDTGTYELTLVATSSLGCVDSSTQNLLALSKYIDATLSKIFLTENNLGDIKVTYQILNSGFNTINDLVVSVDLNNEFEFRESVSTNLYSGNIKGFEMDATFIPDAGRKVDFVCVRILTVNGEQDSIVENNELCELGFNDEFTLKLYPNPVEEILQVQYTLPDDGTVQFELFDALGREQKNGFLQDQEEGVYNMLINVSELDRGIYYYRFIFNGNTKTGKLFKK